MDKRTQDYIEYYNEKGLNYTRDLNLRMILTGGERNFRNKTYKLIEKHLNGKVLDLCCGPGNLTEWMATGSPDCDFTGIDISDKFIEIAKESARFSNARFEVGDATNLRFDDDTFDTVVLSLALHEMEIPVIKKALKEIHRVMKASGKAVLFEHHLPKNPIVRLFYDRVVVDNHERETAYKFHAYGFDRLLEECDFLIDEHQVVFSGNMQIMVVRTNSSEYPHK